MDFYVVQRNTKVFFPPWGCEVTYHPSWRYETHDYIIDINETVFKTLAAKMSNAKEAANNAFTRRRRLSQN